MSNSPYSTRGGITINNIEFSFRTGTEGPQYDPYSWEEITAQKGRDTIVLHEGLAQWLKVNEKEQDIPFDDVSSKFEELVGVKLADIFERNEEQHSKCPKCGSLELEEKSGYPGEHFIVCAKCGEIVDSIFHESEII